MLVQSLTKKESRGNVSYDLEYVQLNSGLNLNSASVDNDGAFQHNKNQLHSSNYSMSGRPNKVKWNNSDGPLFRLKLPKNSKYQLNINARTMAGQSQTKSTTVFIPTQSQRRSLVALSNTDINVRMCV